jgi:hypothetical protein
LNYQINEDAIGGACGMHRAEEKILHISWWKNLKETDYMEGIGVKWRNILKLTCRKYK